MKAFSPARVIVVAAVFLVASAARGETVMYTATLNTSKGNPVYDILILESDASQQVHASIYPSELAGRGISVISHDVPFVPVTTLIIGLTEGEDEDGNDKTQIVMLLDRTFAEAHVGVPFSEIFEGARHSTTIANLQAAVGGDATQLAWFTDTFFSGPAAGAAFDSGGDFVVAEFTSLDIIGANAVFGSWMITGAMTIPFNDPNAIDGRATQVLEETAKGNKGPFDISIEVDQGGQLVVDKTVLNNTGMPWNGFVMQLGDRSGAEFSPSSPGDGLFFLSALNNRETTGAFPNVTVEQDRIEFAGFLAPGASARFIVYIAVDTAGNFTLRQFALCPSSGVPALGPWAVALLTVLLGALAVAKLQENRATPRPGPRNR